MSAIKPFDPLNRIEPEGKLPYAAPYASIADLESWWRAHYAEEARRLPDAGLAGEHGFALVAVASCEAALEGKPQTAEERLRRDRALTRLARLVAKRDAFAAELAARGLR